MSVRQVGPYRLERLLGLGGMGEVHLAYDTIRDRMVALKLLSEALSKDADYQRRFRQESHVAARLREPHVIPIHDYGEVDGQLFIDMRLVEGQNVREILNEGGALPAQRAVHLIGQVADALEAAHADGLVHRDIKPSNVLVAANDFVYVVDFGIARAVGTARGALTLTGVTVGTLDYMAPERFARTEIDGRADVYSLACLLYECLTGRPPFAGDDLPSLMYAHLFDDPPRPTAVVDTLPAAMDEVIASGMAKKLDDRFATPTRLVDAARAALGGEVAPTRGPARAAGDQPQPARHAAASDRPESGRPASDRPASDGPASDGPASDRPASDRPASDQPAPDQPPREVPAPEPAAAAEDPLAVLAAVHVPGSLSPSDPAQDTTSRATDRPERTAAPPAVSPVQPPAPAAQDGPTVVVSRPAAQDGPTVAVPLPVAGPPARPDRPALPGTPSEPRSAGRRRGPLLTVAALVVVAALLAGAAVLFGPRTAAPTNPLAGPPVDGPSAPSIAVPTVRGSIAVGPTPGFLEVAPNGRFAYIANRDAGIVTVLDTAINQATATIPIAAGPPQFVTFSPDGQRAYLSIYNADRTVNLIGVVDTSTNTVVQTIPVGRRPFASQTTPDGRLLYVPSHDDGRLDVIDTASGTVVAQVPVAPNPHWVAFAPDGSRLYTANHESNVVSVLDPADNSVITTIPVGTSPHSTTLSPDGTRVSVVNYDSDEVSVIDTATNAVVATVPVGASPQDIAYSADGRFLYTADVEADQVSVISTETYQVTATIPVGDGPTSVVVSRDGRTGYVTLLNEGSVVMLDLTAG